MAPDRVRAGDAKLDKQGQVRLILFVIRSNIIK